MGVAQKVENLYLVFLYFIKKEKELGGAIVPRKYTLEGNAGIFGYDVRSGDYEEKSANNNLL